MISILYSIYDTVLSGPYFVNDEINSALHAHLRHSELFDLPVAEKYTKHLQWCTGLEVRFAAALSTAWHGGLGSSPGSAADRQRK